MDTIRYVGMDVHKECITIAVLNAQGKVVMESVLETKALQVLSPLSLSRLALPQQRDDLCGTQRGGLVFQPHALLVSHRVPLPKGDAIPVSQNAPFARSRGPACPGRGGCLAVDWGRKHKMSYWVGYRVYDPKIDLKPQAKCLLGPFATRNEAKEAKHKNRGADMLQTDIFEANSKEEAMACLENETFSKL